MSVLSTVHSTRHRITAAAVPSALAVSSAVALTLLTPVTASAHVSMSADTAAAGAYAVLSLNVPHGCEGSPTTRIAVRIPAGVNAVTPTVNQGWTIKITRQKLATPITEDDGDKLTSRVAEVVWTAKSPLPAEFRDVLSLQVAIPEDAAGTQLTFPTLQTCVDGSASWIQVPAPGQDHDELEHPAPVIQVTAAEPEHGEHAAGDADAATTPGPTEHSEHTDPAAVTVKADLQAAGPVTSRSPGYLVGAGMGLVGLLVATVALFRTRAPRVRAERD